MSALTAIGVLMLVIGLACLGYVGYQYFGTNIVAQKAFDDQRDQLRERWSKPAAEKPAKGKDKVEKAIPGEAIALLRIPRFGDDYEVPILSGTSLDILARGVGHYPSSAAPGEIGNFAIAGHRVTHGEPFKRLLELQQGDKVIVETRDQILTYVIDESPAEHTVSDTETWVLDPVPGKPGVKPTEALITLTTCQDLFHSPDRSIGFGHLADVVDK